MALAVAVFAAALGLGYVVSSAGNAEEPPPAVGTRAVPLDVPAAAARQTGLGDTAALPSLARRPPPPAPPPPEPTTPEPEPEPEPAPEPEPEPAPVPEPVPPVVTPVQPAPPPPPPPPPPVAFDDEG